MTRHETRSDRKETFIRARTVHLGGTDRKILYCGPEGIPTFDDLLIQAKDPDIGASNEQLFIVKLATVDINRIASQETVISFNYNLTAWKDQIRETFDEYQNYTLDNFGIAELVLRTITEDIPEIEAITQLSSSHARAPLAHYTTPKLLESIDINKLVSLKPYQPLPFKDGLGTYLGYGPMNLLPQLESHYKIRLKNLHAREFGVVPPWPISPKTIVLSKISDLANKAQEYV